MDQTARKRRGIRPSVRFAVFERDRFRCRYCGASSEAGAVLHVDHIFPHSKGGDDSTVVIAHNLKLDATLDAGRRAK